MADNLNSINSSEQNQHKWWLLERIRNSGRKVLAPVIAAGSISFWWLPAATVPVTAVTAASILTACSSDEPENPRDTVAPTVNVSQHDVDISWWKQIRVSWNQLYIWDILVASWTDNVTKNCKVELSLNWKIISSWTTVSEEWYLTVKVSDDAGNTKTIDIKLNVTQNAPSITVNKYDVNVFWWVTVNVNNNQLLFWNEVIATRTDEDLWSCQYKLNFNWHEIKAWDVINESWKFTLSVTNKLWKSSVVEINITNDAIYGLENLRQALLKVDQEINLLNWLTFADGAELIKTEVEMDGKRSVIADPSHYVPEYPWVCDIIFTVKWRNGNSEECRVDNLNINALDYNAPTINTANMVNEHYSRYNNLKASTKEFIYPHLLASYAACNRSKQDNRVHVIVWETANTSDIENISNFSASDATEHAYESYYRIRALSPYVSIKACSSWDKLEEYVNNHPNDFFVISCASDNLLGYNMNQINSSPYAAPLRRILKKENVIISVANGNRSSTSRKTYNEIIQSGNYYNSWSVNSTKNNKITVVWYNTGGYNNFFSPSSTNVWITSKMPIWYQKQNWNIVMPMAAIVGWNNNENTSTNSSFPTAVTSGILWNAISIVMSNHPEITAEDAMTIIVNNYLNEQKFQYKDETTNNNLVDGWERYFVDIQKLLESELLQSKAIDNIQLNSNLIKLPSGKWICYVGKWIQFEFNWKKYDVTSATQSILDQALKSWNVTRYRNKHMFKKYWWTNSAQFDTYVVDKQWNKIPNLSKSITKSVI